MKKKKDCDCILGYYENYWGGTFFVTKKEDVRERKWIDIYFRFCPNCGKKLSAPHNRGIK